MILSGAAVGSDGVNGLEAIKISGGRTYAQTLETAESTAMPELAIASGFVDSVMLAGEIDRDISLIGVASDSHL